MLDKDKIFDLFEFDKITLEELQVSLKEEPFTKIGMFIKLISNHIIFHRKLKNFLKTVDQEYDEDQTKLSSDFTIFNRAYFYINQIDLENTNHLEAIEHFQTIPLVSALKLAMNFFQREDIEQYEKCSFLHKILILKEKTKDLKK